MTRIGNLREAFDRDMDFEAVKAFKFDGKAFIPGQSFDKTQVTTRRLRQLYDNRYLRMVEPAGDPVVREVAPRPVINIGNMVEDEQPKRAQRVKRVKVSA